MRTWWLPLVIAGRRVTAVMTAVRDVLLDVVNGHWTETIKQYVLDVRISELARPPCGRLTRLRHRRC